MNCKPDETNSGWDREQARCPIRDASTEGEVGPAQLYIDKTGMDEVH